MNLARRTRGQASPEKAAPQSQPVVGAGLAGGTDQRAQADTISVNAFLPHFLREKRASAKTQDAGDGPQPAEEAVAVGTSREIGAHVASVIAAAEHAAVQICQEAEQEAQEIREEAQRQAARLQHEAEDAARDWYRQRSEVETYVADVRAAADVYAEEKRREAETDSVEIKADAEHAARSIVAQAELRAQKIEEAARRRGDQLGRESQRVEMGLVQALNTMRNMAQQIEEQLGLKERRQSAPLEESRPKALKRPTARAEGS